MHGCHLILLVGSLPDLHVHVRPAHYRSALSAQNDETGDSADKRSAWSALNSKPYVPDGLNEKEWTAIKRREAGELRRKDLGAYGPRWSRQNRPFDGDWMLTPSLWVRGFENSDPGVSGTHIDGGALFRQFFLMLRTYAPSLCATYLIVVAASTCIRLTQMATGEGLGLGLRSTAGVASRMAASVASLRTQSVASSASLMASLIFGIRPINALLDLLNRKKLWSKERSAVLVAASTVLIVSIWVGALAVLSPFLHAGV
jgi:hypothetical protein